MLFINEKPTNYSPQQTIHILPILNDVPPQSILISKGNIMLKQWVIIFTLFFTTAALADNATFTCPRANGEVNAGPNASSDGWITLIQGGEKKATVESFKWVDFHIMPGHDGQTTILDCVTQGENGKRVTFRKSVKASNCQLTNTSTGTFRCLMHS